MTPDPVDTPAADTATPPPAPLPDAPAGTLGPKSWIPYVLPFVVYMLFLPFEPGPPNTDPLMEGAKNEQTMTEYLGITYDDYPTIYSIKIGVTVLVMLVMLPAYLKFPFRVSWLAIGVGLVGVVLWILLAWMHLEPKILGPIGLAKVEELGQRTAYNPFEQLAGQGAWMYGFLAIRLFGLALVVPVIEEFFLRGFLMRYVMHPDWWKIPFGTVNLLAVIVGTGVPMLMHPELLAALVWFSMVTWLMVRTKNIWDCVAAHVVTNLLLGLFVISSAWWSASGWWWLW